MNKKTKALLIVFLAAVGVARGQTKPADSDTEKTRTLLSDSIFVNKVFKNIRNDICKAGAENKFGSNKENVIIISKTEECETPNNVGQIKCNGTYKCAVDDMSGKNSGALFNVEYEFICQRGENYYIKNCRRVPTGPVLVVGKNVKVY